MRKQKQKEKFEIIFLKRKRKINSAPITASNSFENCNVRSKEGELPGKNKTTYETIHGAHERQNL